MTASSTRSEFQMDRHANSWHRRPLIFARRSGGSGGGGWWSPTIVETKSIRRRGLRAFGCLPTAMIILRCLLAMKKVAPKSGEWNRSDSAVIAHGSVDPCGVFGSSADVALRQGRCSRVGRDDLHVRIKVPEIAEQLVRLWKLLRCQTR